MQISISLYQLGLFMIFVVGMAVGVLLIVSLVKVNRVVGDVSAMLRKHRDSLDQTIPNIRQISDNACVISQELKKSVKETTDAIELISESTADTVMTINKTADQVGTYAVVISEVIKAIINFFPQESRHAR